MRKFWLRLRRELGVVAPEDGRCTWKHAVTTRHSTYYEVTEETVVWRCREPWRHDGGHIAKREDAIVSAS